MKTPSSFILLLLFSSCTVRDPRMTESHTKALHHIQTDLLELTVVSLFYGQNSVAFTMQWFTTTLTNISHRNILCTMGTVDLSVDVRSFPPEILLADYLLRSSHNSLLHTWTKRLLMFATFIMFVSATASWIEAITDVLLYLPHRLHPEVESPSSLIRKHDELVSANDVFVRIVYVLSDVIVVQRAWVLWPQNRKVRILLCGCVLATIGMKPQTLLLCIAS